MDITLIPTGVAARRIGVSPNYIRRLAETGRLPATITPLGRLFDEAVIIEFARQRRPEIQAGEAAT